MLFGLPAASHSITISTHHASAILVLVLVLCSVAVAASVLADACSYAVIAVDACVVVVAVRLTGGAVDAVRWNNSIVGGDAWRYDLTVWTNRADRGLGVGELGCGDADECCRDEGDCDYCEDDFCFHFILPQLIIWAWDGLDVD